jgi:tRNA(fMet)-specific endonuclease VapC
MEADNMKQITIRSIPDEVKKTVQREAERKGVSLNKAIISLLERAVGTKAPERKKKVLPRPRPPRRTLVAGRSRIIRQDPEGPEKGGRRVMEKNKVMLDTSAYSAYLRGNEDIKQLIREADEIYLSPILLGELYAGFAHGGKEKKNRGILREFLASPRVQVVVIDEETAARYTAIITYLWAKGSPIPTNDLWIASTAMQHGLKLITTDSHFRLVPHIIVECCTA